MKAIWSIKYWKSGSGYSHSETVATDKDDITVITADTLKKSALDWWYNGEWNDDGHDGHNWIVEFYADDADPAIDDPIQVEEFWVYPEDVEA